MNTRSKIIRTLSTSLVLILIGVLVWMSTRDDLKVDPGTRQLTTFSEAPVQPVSIGEQIPVRVMPAVISELKPDADENFLSDELSIDFFEAEPNNDESGVTCDRIYGNTGQLKIERRYLNGALNGDTIRYYPSGEIQMISPYSNGKLDGTQKTMYQDGMIQMETAFQLGVMHGSQLYYFNTGEKRYEMNWSDGQRTGEMRSWYLSGELRIEGSYFNGKPTGEHRQYYSAGAIQSLTSYDDAGQYKSSRSFSQTGDLQILSARINGRAVTIFDRRRNIDKRKDYPEFAY